jgi:pyruvate dehydrogenase E2 component (dihydrolipoamide acetyltransferase)
MHEVLMPRADVLMKSGAIVQWFKNEGDNVAKGEPVVLIEAEKTAFEIEAQDSGLLRKILKQQGEEASVGETLALIGALDEEIPDQFAMRAAAPERTPAKALTRDQEGLSVANEIRASPAARSFARQHGVDLSRVKGTGPRGRIQLEDVQRAAEAPKVSPPNQVEFTHRIKERVPLAGVRKVVAERLSYSFHTVVPVMLTAEVDFEALEETRKSLGPSVSLTAFLVKSVASSLRKNLILNSSLEAEEIVVYDDINIAVATNTPEGLFAPVIFEPERKSLLEISREIADMRDRALSGKLAVQELTGGTFTVTNLGGEGIEIFAPIINPPQAAILALGRAVKKPVAVDDSIQIRLRATLSLMFDHRVTDGVPAAQFLAQVKQLLENPISLLDKQDRV